MSLIIQIIFDLGWICAPINVVLVYFYRNIKMVSSDPQSISQAHSIKMYIFENPPGKASNSKNVKIEEKVDKNEG